MYATTITRLQVSLRNNKGYKLIDTFEKPSVSLYKLLIVRFVIFRQKKVRLTRIKRNVPIPPRFSLEVIKTLDCRVKFDARIVDESTNGVSQSARSNRQPIEKQQNAIPIGRLLP